LRAPRTSSSGGVGELAGRTPKLAEGAAGRAGAASGFAGGNATGAIGGAGSSGDGEDFGVAVGAAGDAERLAISLGFAAIVRGSAVTACPDDAAGGDADGVVATVLAGAGMERGVVRWLGADGADSGPGAVATGTAGEGGAVAADDGGVLAGMDVGGELGTIAAGGLGVVAMGRREGGMVVPGPGGDTVCSSPSGRALGRGGSVLPGPFAAMTAITMPPARAPIAAATGQRRPPRSRIVLSPAEPERVEGAGREAVAGASTARAGSGPMTPLVRCMEIAAWVSDPAYVASARASSATSGNRLAGSFSRQR
jgi:hypothetical protein